MGSITTWGFLSWTSWKCIPPGGWQEHPKTGQSHTTSTATNPGEKTFIAHFLLLFKKKMFFLLLSAGMKMQHSQKLCFFLPWLCWVSANLAVLPPFCFFPFENLNFSKPSLFGGEGSKQREKWLVALERSSFPSHCQQLHPSLP